MTKNDEGINEFAHSLATFVAFDSFILDVAEGNVSVAKPELRKCAIYFALQMTGEFLSEASSDEDVALEKNRKNEENELEELHGELWELFKKEKQMPPPNVQGFEKSSAKMEKAGMTERLQNVLEKTEEWIAQCDTQLAT